MILITQNLIECIAGNTDTRFFRLSPSAADRTGSKPYPAPYTTEKSIP